MNSKIDQQRRQILDEMVRIERMEFGSLGEELRPRVIGGKEVVAGPYFKHQQWSDGRNRSRRVPAEEVEGLRAAIEGRQNFEALASRFVELTVAETRTQTVPEVKKNATKSTKRNSRKPKRS